MIFVSQQQDIPRDRSPVVDVDDMDIEKEESDDDDCAEPALDDDDREAPSEQDTDEAPSRGENAHLEAHSEESESIHTQSSPRDFGASPVNARVLNYDDEPLHVTSLGEDVADEPHQDSDQEVAHDDEHEARDSQEEVQEEDAQEEDQEAREKEDGAEELHVEADPGEDTPNAEAEQPRTDLATTSRPASPPRDHEVGVDYPTPSPSQPKSSKRGKHKDRQSRRHRAQEPAITESFIEDKIVSVLQHTLPNMLSGMLAEAMVLARQIVPQPSPTTEAAVGTVEPASVVDGAAETHNVGVQHMVEGVDGATSPNTMDTDNVEANVSIRNP